MQWRRGKETWRSSPTTARVWGGEEGERRDVAGLGRHPPLPFAPPGKVRLSFRAPSRGLIGFQAREGRKGIGSAPLLPQPLLPLPLLQSELKTETRGSAMIHRIFDGYGPYLRGLDRKPRCVMVSNGPGQITAYSLDNVQSRGVLFVRPGEQTYAGHIVGECSRDSLYDMDVNVVRPKKLTNIRAAGADDAVRWGGGGGPVAAPPPARTHARPVPPSSRAAGSRLRASSRSRRRSCTWRRTSSSR